MWDSYKKFTKEHWAAAYAHLGIIHLMTVGFFHMTIWVFGSIFYMIYGIAWLGAMCIWWLIKYTVLGFIALIKLLFRKKETTQAFNSTTTDTRHIPASIQNMDGWQYEHYVAEKLKAEGFHNVQVTSSSGDFGADIIAYDIEGRKYCIQCKLYSSPVGVKAVQEIIAGKEYYGGNIAMVITNSTFTNAALEMAKRTGVALRSNYI